MAELALIQVAGEFGKVLKSYRKYNLLEIIEARSKKGFMIFCAQYETGDWYSRIHPDSDERSAIAEAVLDRIIHNSYEVLVDGKISIRERHGLKRMADMTLTRYILNTEYISWFHNKRNTEQAKSEILALFSDEPDDLHEWSKQGIYEQARKIIARWDNI